MKNPLLDKDFLKQLDSYYHKEVFAKVISMNYAEEPINEIIGRVTQGSISIDGASAVRRSCSLTLVADNMNEYGVAETNLSDYYWGLNTKFNLYIGLKNVLDPSYPDIIWFPQGIYLITSFNTSFGTNSFQISLQGKDKMSLLNGEIGGNITAKSVDFGHLYTLNDDASVTKMNVLLKDIILEAVHEYAKEPFQNIIIEDLDDLGLEYMRYNGSVPLYIFLNLESNEAENFTLNENMMVYLEPNGKQVKISDESIKYDTRIKIDVNGTIDPTIIYMEVEQGKFVKHSIIKCEASEVIGYRTTDLTYAGDLIGNVGDSITSACLDKIVGMLGDYEYFYDVEGRFHFQRKKIYINTSFNSTITQEADYIIVDINEDNFIENKYYTKATYTAYELAEFYDPRKTYYKKVYNESYQDNSAYTSTSIYSFLGNNLISSFSNNPNLANIKNDYSIWGERDNGGNKLPIHLRYAIDRKPQYYKTYDGVEFYTSSYRQDGKECDWRELIYQMSQDYKQNGHTDDFNAKIAINNNNYYPNGYTGYEQYYTDLDGFWRQLYDPHSKTSYGVAYCTKTKYEENPSKYYWYVNCKDEVYDENREYYILDLSGRYSRRSNLIKKIYDRNPSLYYYMKNGEEENYVPKERVYYEEIEPQYNESGWSYTVLESPETLNFWFDFLDTEGELGKYSIKNIGDRPKTENSNTVKSIYFREIPTVIFIPTNISTEKLKEQKLNKTGYTFFQLPDNIYSLFSNSARGLSAMDKLDELLYDNTCAKESISISAIPIYYLEPNTRIFVRDDESGINGEYIVSKISYSLGHSGMMSISASKAVERIY